MGNNDEWDKSEYEINLDEILGVTTSAVKELDAMLTGVMTHLHETGADTFEILRDQNLNAWWGKKLKEIKKQKEVNKAREIAKSTMTKEQRKLLGLDF
jgi:methionyl-tRNA synthetase